MRYLLDTMVFLWSQTSLSNLNAKAVDALRDGTNDIFLSAASSWEMAIKASIGKLKVPEPLATYIPKRFRTSGIQPLVITHSHAVTAAELPAHHQDPFDRMLVAQAQSEGLMLMTADRQLAKYDVDLLWCGR